MIKIVNKVSLLLLMVFTISFASCQQNNGKGGKVSADEFEKLLSANSDAQLIDVRSPGEFESGHIKNATNIDVNGADFEPKVNGLNKSKPVFVYCLSGGRSSGAASYMRQSGFKIVYEMPGIISWRNAGKPLVEGNAAPETKSGLSLEAYLQKVNSENFVLVDFNAVWCKPCKQLTPILEKIAADKKDKLTLIKIDADENPELLKQKGIEGIPYLELYKGGKLVWKHNGFIDEASILKETNL